MDSITIGGACANNLKNVSLNIPLKKLVVLVGKSGSGKSSLAYDVLIKASRGQKVQATVENLPKTFAIEQRVRQEGKLSLGQTNFGKLVDTLSETKKGDLLIVDEPCAGMAVEDVKMVLGMLKTAVRKGVSVIAVEHSKEFIIGADHVVEFGPGSGRDGGHVVFDGSIRAFRNAKTITSEYVFSDKAGDIGYVRMPNEKSKLMRKRTLSIKGISANNLNDYDLSLPLGSLVCISGRIGTGKSTLLSVVYGALFKGKDAWKTRKGFKSIEGKADVRRAYLIDQTPLSTIATSTPTTYLGIWDAVRDFYAKLPEAKKARLDKSHFSFNSSVWKNSAKLGRIEYRGISIYDLTEKTLDEAAVLFEAIPLVKRKLGFLREVGLGYLTLGQKSGTLSGGEAQRVRIAKVLSKKLGDRCIYILDTPSRGLHLSDLPPLIGAMQKIIDKNNTVLIAENREEMIRNCDYAIDLR